MEKFAVRITLDRNGRGFVRNRSWRKNHPDANEFYEDFIINVEGSDRDEVARKLCKDEKSYDILKSKNYKLVNVKTIYDEGFQFSDSFIAYCRQFDYYMDGHRETDPNLIDFPLPEEDPDFKSNKLLDVYVKKGADKSKWTRTVEL